MAIFSEEVHGRVIRDLVSRGSKSEHHALLIETPDGERLMLRRRGGPAFGDTSFDALVGKTIIAKGDRIGRTFIVGSWSRPEPEDRETRD